MIRSFRSCVMAVCCALALGTVTLPALAAEDSGAGKLSADMETALSEMLDAVSPGTTPSLSAMNTILGFINGPRPKASAVDPKTRDQGAGSFYEDTLNIPLRTLMNYTLDPGIPGDTVYPTSVRSNYWYPESELLKNSQTLRAATFPPANPLVTRGVEYEETSPDTSSGCYYVYRLNRLFVLTSFEGRTVLFSVSSMPRESSVGRKGVIVGKDSDWSYVYTPTVGTNLSMLGWAETFLYGSASVTVFMESAPGSNATNMYVFKWAKAGWSGMNVVKRSHIAEGVKRFAQSLKTVLESPKKPTPEAIKGHLASLKVMDDTALRAALAPLARQLATQSLTSPELNDKEFQKILANDAYADSLNRNQLINELMKLFMRKQLGLSVPAGA